MISELLFFKEKVVLQNPDWEQIIDRHGQAVWAAAYRLLGNHADASDCFSETFVTALEISRKQKINNFCALLVKLATWRAIDQLRKKTRQPNMTGDLAIMNNIQGTGDDPDSRAEKNELSDQLRTALAKLPEKEAQAFCLRYLNDLSYQQIAKQMNIKLNSTGVLLHRAKKNLRQILRLQKQDSEVEL